MSGKHSEEGRKRIKNEQNNNKYANYSENEQRMKERQIKQQPKKKKKNKAIKIIGIIILILVLILAGVLGGAYWYVHDKLGKMQQVEIDEDNLSIDNKVQQNLSGYRNIALFGVDSRDDDLGKGNRSDCIIIASINNKTKEVKLLSVYRDTYLQIEGHGLDKVTHAYAYGGPELAIQTLNTNLDLNIKEFVTVNFDSVAAIVNKLGGVTINIEQSEIKYINEYIDATSKITGISSKHVTKSGKQTLDGVQAVAYSRIRYTAGGDYKRTERMRNVLEAMVNKVKTKSIGEINEILDYSLPMIYTNINANDIVALIPDALNYKITESIGWPYDTKGITLSAWYGVPVTLESNVIKLHQELFAKTDYTPTETVQEISNKIIKKTGYK